jgi:DNA-binding NtrC family response regulator
VSESTVGDVVRRNGNRMRGRGGPNNLRVPHGEFRVVAQLYEAGLSERQVAERLGITRTAVQYRLDQAGVRRRNPAEARNLAR